MPKIAQDENQFPYRLIDAPWKVATATTLLSGLALLITRDGFGRFIPPDLLVLIFIFCAIYSINILLFRRMQQREQQRRQLQQLVQTLQATNRQLTHNDQALQAERAELEQQNSALNSFAHTLAHDLKNLLAIVVQNNDLLVYYTETPAAQQPPGIERLQRAAKRSHDAARHMAKIVDTVLLLAGVSAQQHAPIQPLAMGTILIDVQRRLAQLLTTHQAEVAIVTTLPLGLGYAPWVEEVWVNYLENAIKYGGRPPYIAIGGETLPNGFVRFWVQDNGAGLPVEDQRLLFVEFTQLKRLDQSSHGLGLSIAKHIAEKLGGAVGVESTVGQGSKFYFTLPAATDNGEGMTG